MSCLHFRPALSNLVVGFRGYGATGVRETVTTGWKKRSTERLAQYEAIVEARVELCKRSDMTDDCSLLLYASQFNPDTQLSMADQVYMSGTDAAAKQKKPLNIKEGEAPPEPSAFVKKAERVGIAIRAHPRQLVSGASDALPFGFEQINDNMFSRKANKFMVFNLPGVLTWKDSPVTRPCPVESILMSTASASNS